jgi:hypothetical protein
LAASLATLAGARPIGVNEPTDGAVLHWGPGDVVMERGGREGIVSSTDMRKRVGGGDSLQTLGGQGGGLNPPPADGRVSPPPGQKPAVAPLEAPPQQLPDDDPNQDPGSGSGFGFKVIPPDGENSVVSSSGGGSSTGGDTLGDEEGRF